MPLLMFNNVNWSTDREHTFFQQAFRGILFDFHFSPIFNLLIYSITVGFLVPVGPKRPAGSQVQGPDNDQHFVGAARATAGGRVWQRGRRRGIDERRRSRRSCGGGTLSGGRGR